MAKGKSRKARETARTSGLFQVPPIEPTRPASTFQRWVPPVSVYLAAILVYLPSLDNKFVSWDDDHYIYDNVQLVHEKGLADIWTNVKHTPYAGVKDSRTGKVLKDSTHQYYPLLFSLFWLEHRLFGDDASVFKIDMEARGFHAGSMILHAVNSVLLILLLHRLGVGVWPAWLVAALFSVHPMNVASVAWAAEGKNILALFFYMLAMMAYLRFRRRGGWGFYAATLVLFQCALWSKTVALTFPLVLVLTDRLIQRRWDLKGILPILPMFVLSLVAALTTAYVEDRDRTVPLVAHQRPFVAAASTWFYPAKLLVPVKQLPIYELWNPDPINYQRWNPAYDLKWWAPLVGAAAAGWALFHWRSRITAALGPQFWWGLGFYLITQFPMMGWKNINFFQFAYVAEHYIYNGCAGVLLIFALALDALRRRAMTLKLEPPLVTGLACAALGAYGVKTYRYCDVWQDSETFWNTTLAGNPGCWAGWFNLGNQYKRDADRLLREGDEAASNTRIDMAIERYKGAVKAKPNLRNAYNQLAPLLLRTKRYDELERYCDQEIEMLPGVADPYYYKGLIQEAKGDCNAAEEYFKKALSRRLDQDLANSAATKLGTCMMRTEQWAKAIPIFELAVQKMPRNFDVRRNLGICYLKENRLDEAEEQFNEAQKLRPNDSTVQSALDEIRRQRG